MMESGSLGQPLKQLSDRLAVAAPQDQQVVVLRPVMWMFLAVLFTFLLTRLITRYIRRSAEHSAQSASAGRSLIGNISLGGVHIHHQVFGIFIMLITGLILIAATPEGAALNVVAFGFGVGVSLVFDEFALWLHLEDVYWSAEGRQSVDAIFCVLLVTGALIGGADLLTGELGSGPWWLSVGFLALVLMLSILSLLKGKVITGVVGVLVSPLVVVGALRLAKPGSWWANRHYPPGSKQLRRAQSRFGAAYVARWNWLRDLVGGKPDA